MKKCLKCQELKPITEFHKDNSRKDKLYPYCKPCHIAKNVLHNKKRLAEDPEFNRKRHRRYFHGQDVTNLYDNLLVQQNFCCAICGISAGNTQLSLLRIDEDHNNSMKIRGLLCDKCNRGLGFFRDDIIILESAIGYLNDHKNML